MSRVVSKLAFAYTKTKTQISFAVTAKLISTFVFATWIVLTLNTKFHVFSHLVWLYSPVCVRHGRKPRRQVFSQRVLNEPYHNKATKTIKQYITKTCPCNEDPFTPHFYIVKLGFTGVNIIFLFLL